MLNCKNVVFRVPRSRNNLLYYRQENRWQLFCEMENIKMKVHGPEINTKANKPKYTEK